MNRLQSQFRGFRSLVVLSFQRHWRVRQMGWVALGLLSVIVIWDAAVTLSPAGWGLENRRVRRSQVTYGVSGTPTFVLVDEKGKIEWRQVGYSPKDHLGIPGWKWDGD